VLCAAELALDECGEESVHTVNDATKLADPANNITRGYLLFFVRDKLKDYNRNIRKIHKELNAAAKRIRVVIASKSEEEYWGAWGDF
jgi:trimethylamine:corrinoid methyltransferase-like protein